MMSAKLDWLQQLGYAVSEQQSAVMDSVQRLRRQAQAAGQLTTTPQIVVSTEDSDVLIAPAQSDEVYVPAYDPAIAYGAWPYAMYPPVYLAPPQGYYPGPVLGMGLVFGVGVAIVGGLWGWATPNWRGRNVVLNVNGYNRLNVGRPPIASASWRAAPIATRQGGFRPPAGPVGRAAAPRGVPANAIGRSTVAVPGGVVRPPAGMGPDNRPPISQGGNNRPGVVRPAASQGGRPSGSGPAALGGINEGRSAAQYGNRGAQSRQAAAPARRAAAPSRPAPAPAHGGGQSHGGGERR
jgi:hypothetical protein